MTKKTLDLSRGCRWVNRSAPNGRMRKGMCPFTTSITDSLQTALKTKKFMPEGEVIKAGSILMVDRTPK